jgi:hypothetical protein
LFSFEFSFVFALQTKDVNREDSGVYVCPFCCARNNFRFNTMTIDSKRYSQKQLAGILDKNYRKPSRGDLAIPAGTAKSTRIPQGELDFVRCNIDTQCSSCKRSFQELDVDFEVSFSTQFETSILMV